MNIMKSILYYLKNKSVSLIVLAAAIVCYAAIPSGTPFVELAYTAVTVLATVTLAPVIRLLVFNEAAVYAETGLLDRDIRHRTFTPALIHYWFATFISYAAPLCCIATIAK